MAPLALALQLVVAAPDLAPRLDPGGPFRSGELALASAGVLAGDVLVVGGGFLTLQLFAQGAISPTATNFRRAAYVLGASAILVPPLTAVVLARLGGRGGAGSVWRALLLATAGHAAALGVAYLAAPHFWLMLPVQVAGVSLGTSYGLHWGRRGPPHEAARAPAVPPREPPATVSLLTPICPDG
jgi:hypothetical protein